MTLIETIQNQQSQTIKDIKTVKKATVTMSGNTIYCRHYETIIFAYDIESKLCEIVKDCSTTSNRQIKYLIEALNIDESQITDLNKNHQKFSKWEFSGEFTQ